MKGNLESRLSTSWVNSPQRPLPTPFDDITVVLWARRWITIHRWKLVLKQNFKWMNSITTAFYHPRKDEKKSNLYVGRSFPFYQLLPLFLNRILKKFKLNRFLFKLLVILLQHTCFQISFQQLIININLLGSSYWGHTILGTEKSLELISGSRGYINSSILDISEWKRVSIKCWRPFCGVIQCNFTNKEEFELYFED